MLVSLSLSLLNIGVSLLLIRSYGEIGAAISFVAVSATTAAAYLLVFKRTMSIPASMVVWVGMLAAIVTFALIGLLRLHSSLAFALVLSCGAAIAYVKTDLKYVIDFVKSGIRVA